MWQLASTGEMLWWFLLGLASLVAVVYLLSLRRTYSIKGKHVVVRVTCVWDVEVTLNHGYFFSFFFLIKLVFICLCHTLKITGGSSGIGKALAAEALQKGTSTVVLVARNQVNNN